MKKISRRTAMKQLGAAAGIAAAAPKLLGCSDDDGGGPSGPGRISTLVVLCMENRSYDHYLGARAFEGKPGDGLVEGMMNLTGGGAAVPIFRADVPCIADPPHDWTTSHDQWNAGANDIVTRRLRDGFDVGEATAVNDPAAMSEFDRVALERDERFNTRVSSTLGWERAARKLIPTPRRAAQFDLTAMVMDSGARTAADAVEYLAWRTVRVPMPKAAQDRFTALLTAELGTDNLERAKTYLEEPLRMTVHLIMSTPEYQIV